MRVLVTGGSGFIGSYLLRELRNRGQDVLSIDIKKPSDSDTSITYLNCTLMDIENLKDIVNTFDPNIVIHLAARTNPPSQILSDYEVNFIGTDHLINVLSELKSLRNVIFVSTQHVIAPGKEISDNLKNYEPLGAYGYSKMLMEQNIFAKASFNFTIVRPTNVWGYGNKILENGIWRVINNGFYIHPKSANCVRNYGYVENVVWQISEFACNWNQMYNQQIFYVGDENTNQFEWLNKFSNSFGRGDIRVIPDLFVKALAQLGSLIRKLHIDFPIDRARYLNLITANPIPIEKTLELIGKGPVLIENAIDLTVRQLKRNNSNAN